MQPRVLIISERPAERDTIRVLVGTMGCQWVLASGLEEALVILGREPASAALLDLPNTGSDADPVYQCLRELLVRLPGRVIVLADEARTSTMSEFVSKYSIPVVNRDRLAMDLWPCLETMVYPHRGVRRITQVARLILDTFLQPLPAGIRFLEHHTRQLVYEAKSLTADISFEHPPDSTRTTLVGQIMQTNEPRLPLNGVSIVLKGKKGPLGMKMANESGEFSFEFQDERTVTLEIEVSPNEWVALVSPSLDWGKSERDRSLSASASGGGSNSGMYNGKVHSKKAR